MKKLMAILCIALILAVCTGCSGKNGAEDGKMEAPALNEGDKVFFGHYEQDGDAGNGAEPIQWEVADLDGSKALLVSSYVLDVRPFHDTDELITWENSSVRAWLNGEFMSAAFSESDQRGLILADVRMDDNAKSGADAGSNTQDRVFLLSAGETDYKYNGLPLKAAPTAYAAAKGVEMEGSENCYWWLRTPGYIGTLTCFVDVNGEPSLDGVRATLEIYGIRPACWVDAAALSK